MPFVHELIKNDKKKASQAFDVLTSDPNAHKQVYIAENTHRRLIKLGEEDLAKKYFAKATEIYPYSTYFEGNKANLQ